MNNRQNRTAEELFSRYRKMQNNGMDEKAQEKEILQFANRNMNEAQKQKLQSILQDKNAVETLLQSEQAQMLLKKLGKKP